MKLINSSVEFLGETKIDPNLLLKDLEIVGRLCYKSEEKITTDSALNFCNHAFNIKHYSIFDHSNIVIKFNKTFAKELYYLMMFYPRMSAYHLFKKKGKHVYINGNIRAWFNTITELVHEKESNSLALAIAIRLNEYLPSIFKFNYNKDLYTYSDNLVKLIKNPKDIPNELKMYSFRWIHDRSVSHEAVRHRPMAHMQESQRYITYSSGLTYIIPPNVTNFKEGEYTLDKEGKVELNSEPIGPKHKCNMNELYWIHALIQDEELYKNLIKHKDNPDGWTPQHARDILANSCKTENIFTADPLEWHHFFSLRCTKHAHPKIRKLATETLNYMYKELPNYFQDLADLYLKVDN